MSHAKISQSQAPLGRDHDVGWFYVPVDNILLVRLGQRVAQANANRRDELGQWLGAIFKEFREALAIDKLEDDIGRN